MKKWLVILLLCVMGGYAIFQSVAEKAKPEIGIEVGKSAPDISVTTFDGKVVPLSSFYGKPVIVNFFATWCPPCRAEMPEIQKFYKANKDKINIVAIDIISSDTEEKVVTFVKEHQLTFPVVFDKVNGEIGEAEDIYKIRTLPISFILSKDGIIQQQFIGPMTYDTMDSLTKNLMK